MASAVSMPTNNGDPLKLKKIDDDVLLPDFFPISKEQLQSIKDLEGRDNDILICSYPKSGSHWTVNIIKKMLLRNMEESSKETFSDQMLRLIGMAPPECITNAVSPRLLISHLRPHRMPKYFQEGKAKVVLVLRNPKDVAVSFFYHLKNSEKISNKQDWNEYMASFLTGEVPFRTPLDFFKAWQAELNANKALDIEYFYYEELKSNGVECLRRLAKHLNFDFDDKELKSLIDECSFKKLKEEADKTELEEQSILADKDGKSIIYRKGEIGDWKNHFTVAQNEMYDTVLEEAMKDGMFTFKYE